MDFSEIVVALANLDAEELKGLEAAIKEERKSRRSKILEDNRNARVDRENTSKNAAEKGELAEGSKITFLFARKEKIGVVTKVNAKSVSVKFELNGDPNTSRYVKYQNILSFEPAVAVEAVAS